MMILVAVTVTFTIGENGILAQAKESGELAEQAQLHEQIMGDIKLTDKGKIIVGDSYEAAKALLESQGYDVGDFNEADGTFEVTGKKGTYKYKITETEITIEETKGEETKPIIPTDQKYLKFTHDETKSTSTFMGMNSDYLMDNGYYGEDNYVITDLVIPAVVKNDSGEESIVTQTGSSLGPTGENLTIKTVVLPETVEYITPYSFCNWQGLTSINIPSKVKGIYHFAFNNCTNLTEITIPKGVTSLSGPIFQGCKSLISITLPDGFNSLNGPVFQNCTSLTSVYLPSSINTTSTGCFSGCSSDLKIYVDKYEEECSSWTPGWADNATVIYKTNYLKFFNCTPVNILEYTRTSDTWSRLQ